MQISRGAQATRLNVAISTTLPRRLCGAGDVAVFSAGWVAPLRQLPGNAVSAAAPTAPTIRRLSIARFRGIGALTWWPSPGVNVVLGGGDVGETTIADAIGLLLSPVNSSNFADADYFCRRIEDGFEIEAVMPLPAMGAIDARCGHRGLGPGTGRSSSFPPPP